MSLIEGYRGIQRPDDHVLGDSTLADPAMREEEVADKDLDGEEGRKLLRKLLSWLRYERDRQAENRVEMARDDDFYHGLQWSQEDAQALEDRGQAPLVFNQIAVAINWLIGSEKRNRVDWRVLPREEDDTELAGVKTKVLKYVSDVNRSVYARSQAFSEAAISGLSWLEASLNGDATGDILYSGYESWRNVLHDSHALRLDYKDGRYWFRWKVMDLDIAQAMFPKRKGQLARAASSASQLAAELDREMWYLGELVSNTASATSAGYYQTSDLNTGSHIRTRVRVYECWYKVPEETKVVRGGTFSGQIYDPTHRGMASQVESGYAEVIPSVVMRMHCAFFTDKDLLAMGPSPFRHNDFPCTPVWCFRRGRDLAPYGYVRNLRDPQTDINKRMSKSLFLLSVNQLITEFGAFDQEGEYTLQDAIENASNPQGVFIMRDGSKKFEIRRDYQEMVAQHQQIELNMRFMQTGSGITDELMGRRTNAVSGEAIKARQDQGSASTAGIFDTFRLAISLDGQKQLSNAEQFYTTPKVIRLTEWAPSAPDATQAAPGSPMQSVHSGLEWVRLNQPELQPDGSVRFLNDMTASMADFIVDEQDFRASMRQSMFESLSEMVNGIARVNPTFAISMLDMVVDLADFPGKEQMVARLRQLIAEARGETPGAAKEAGERAALEKRAAAAKIAKDEAAADKSDAEADQIRVGFVQGMVALDPQRTPAGQATPSAQVQQQPQPPQPQPGVSNG